MQRFARIILISIILGFALNVAVTWLIAWRVGAVYPISHRQHYLLKHYPDRAQIHGQHEEGFGSTYFSMVFIRQRPEPQDHFSMSEYLGLMPASFRKEMLDWCGDVDSPSPPCAFRAIIARGWPMRAFYSVADNNSDLRGLGPRSEFIDRGAIIIPRPGMPGTGAAPFFAIALPYYPMWGGIVVNTLVYAALVWLLLNVGTARQWNRYRRGRCPRCGYDLRGRFDEGCSECGWRRTSPRETADARG